ncbi:fatty acid synthase S-acetyltransferase [Xylariales sp. PMI_506]|nr:fatty acid synthase S-acetyltransferase [Xylariales sp. PMI_506]
MGLQRQDDIAIIGMASKLPRDASSADAFFDLLVQGRSALTEVPSSRYNIDAFYHPDQDRGGAVNSRLAHYIQGDIAAFDAPFFSITPTEAANMDPQQRGMLETVYHALENGGITMAKALHSLTSVYVGCSINEYGLLVTKDPEVDLTYAATGTGPALLSNRLSWFYDFRGPSLTVDTACSSSLNACHLAVQGLKAGEADMAIVGGCNIFYDMPIALGLKSMGFFSPDGKCYSFDHRANGYSRGEGYGALVLKRVSDAIRDGDTIRAVIRGTSSNQDGRSPGITQPTRSGQVALIKAAYANAGIGFDKTRFFEAHGTGTQVGDPIEAGAISEVFTQHRSAADPIYVGAVKTNIGHLEGASGVASLIKTVYVLENGIIPPNLWFEKPNPKIPVEEWHLRFPTETTSWIAPGVRRASVNSFGFGGSNAHVVLDDSSSYLEESSLLGIHSTLACSMYPPSSTASNTDRSTNGTCTPSDETPSVSDHANEPAHLKQLSAIGDELQRYLTSLHCTWSLLSELNKDEEHSLINNAAYSQPICTILQVALVELLRSWSVFPSIVVGHSSGEIAAAFAADAIPRESAWKISYHRGVLSERLSHAGGEAVGMLSVALSPEMVRPYIEQVERFNSPGSLTIACYNSPKNVTVSGNLNKIKSLQELLDHEGVFTRMLKVENAYHSSYMEAIADEYLEAVGIITGKTKLDNSRGITFYSSLTGQRENLEQLQTAAYWVRNLTNPVKFSQVITQMIIDNSADGTKVGNLTGEQELVSELLEIGPHSALQGPLREIMEQIPSAKDVGYTSLLKRKANAIETALAAVGWLYCRGQPVAIGSINRRGIVAPKMLIDLPPYEFNHSKTFWKESRISKQYRFRKHPRLELLGAPVPDWNKSNAIWRNWIRMSENPWIKDHRITGSILYPAAGMLVMAIEASRQLANPKKPLKGFRMREIALHMALRVPTSSDGVETHFYLRPYFESRSSTSSHWNEFQLCSFDGEEWREHCRGLIQTEYETAVSPVDNGLEQRMFEEACAKSIADAETACKEEVSSKQLYEILHTVGFDFGATFQTLSDIAIDRSFSVVATVKEPDIASRMKHGFVQPYLIHPTTLDGIFQSVLVAMTNGGAEVDSAMVPTSVKELWVAADGHARHDSYRLSTRADFSGLRQATANVTAVDPVTRKPIITAVSIVSTAISDENEQQSSKTAHKHLCFNIDWKPDVHMISPDQAVKYLQSKVPSTLHEANISEVIADVEKLCYIYLRRFTSIYDVSNIDETKPWNHKYVNWARGQLLQYALGEMGPRASDEDWDALALDSSYIAALETKLERNFPESQMQIAVGRVLGQIMDGSVDPLELLLHHSIESNPRHQMTGWNIGVSYLTNYIDLIAHKDSDLTILEVAAGTGDATASILGALLRQGDADDGIIRFERYDCTDISATNTDIAKERLAKVSDRMRFTTLNINHDPVKQGFQSGMYDLVIASNCLHAAVNVDVALKNIRSLLKPGGRLLLQEFTNPRALRNSFVFGLLPGWWQADHDRQNGPLLTTSEWNVRLQRAGFNTAELAISDYPEAVNQNISVIVATSSLPESETRTVPPAMVIFDSSSELQKEIALQLQASPCFKGRECALISLNHLSTTNFSGKLCIFLPDIETSTLNQTEEHLFASLKKMVAGLDTLIWITHGGGPAPLNPHSELVSGFARVIRQESPGLKFYTVAFEEVASVSDTVNYSSILMIDTLVNKDKSRGENNFWINKNGVISIQRLIEDSRMNQAVALKTSGPVAHNGSFGGVETRALKLSIKSPGLLNSLQFVEDSTHYLPLAEDDVEFKVMSAGLNFLDVMVALGQVSEDNLGVEGAGIVTRAASNSRFKIGDRVCGIAARTIGTFARGKETTIIRVPDELSWVDAAGFTVIFVTAFAALYDIANIQPGESVLIHSAAGGVGQACIQLAKLRGAEIYATVGSLAKRDLLMKTYGLPQDHIFSSRDLTFAQGLSRMTGGRGVDVAVNSLSGDALRATWDCIAPFGRFVEIGKVDIFSSARLNMEKFRCNVRFEFVDVKYMAIHNGPKFLNLLENVMELLKAGKISCLAPIHCFPFSQIQEAFRFMQSGVHTGKIVLEPHDEDVVPIVVARKCTSSFDGNASFVISGGLGGLGQSISRWMASRGAKNLILLSRSGPTRDDAKALLKELENAGVRVATPQCDVSDAESLHKALDECTYAGMPPIRGCIQSAMVLRDAIFMNMSIDDYQSAIKPKVQASWNLHNCLPKDLDFFILLSSVSNIIGNRGQTNYNAGNSFQDAVARHRVMNGLKGTSIDLGTILSVGYVAEGNPALLNHLRDSGIEPMREEELLAILDQVCKPALTTGDQALLGAQICLGLQTPEMRIAMRAEEPAWMSDPMFKHLHRIRTLESSTETDGKSANYALHLAAAESIEVATDILYEAIVSKLVNTLNITAEDIDPTKPLHSLGVDSLVGVELRTWVMTQLGANVAVFDIMEVSNVKALARLVASRSSLVKKTGLEQ